MIMPRANFAVEAFSGRLYVFGGSDLGGKQTDQAEVYDPASDQWSALPSMPGRRMNHACASVGGKLYVIGGISYTLDYRDRMKTIDVYDLISNSWTSFDTHIPFESEMSSVKLGTDIYLFS